MTKLIKSLTLATAVASGITVNGAIAVNPGYDYAAGDLLVGIQTTGANNNNFVLVNLGSAQALRDATGTLLLANAGAALTAQFGLGWFDRTDLYMGSIAAWDNDPFNESLLNGDPAYTLYLSSPRNAAGSAGLPNSSGYSYNEQATVSAVDNAISVEFDFESRGTAGISTLSNAGSFVDWADNNPITAGVQGTAFSSPSGIQTKFGAGLLGNIGGVNAEAAVDVYRLQIRNDIPGQAGFGAPNGVGTFEGTIAVDSTGQFSFVVPEPSTAVLLGISLLGFAARRRRPVTA